MVQTECRFTEDAIILNFACGPITVVRRIDIYDGSIELKEGCTKIEILFPY